MAASPHTAVKHPRRQRWADATRGDRAGGLTMTVAAVAALLWANWPGVRSYHRVWTAVAPWSAPLGLGLTERDWVDQALLLVFFTVVGLEIRREFTVGELRSPRRAMVPIVAALVGMAVPALIYTAVLAGGAGASGWGIPMATDVAFALGALALIGGATPRARVFLMTLAVADDIASIVILVAFYSRHTNFAWLAGGVAAVVAMAGVWASRRPWGWLRGLLAAVAWWSLLHAGVEAAVVGVAIGGFGPRRRPAGDTGPVGIRRAELRLQSVDNLVVLPLFALANIGVVLSGSVLLHGPGLRLLLAVAVARVIGKPAGIAGATLALRRRTRPPEPPRISRRVLVGTGTVASIGFTVPLLIIRTALPVGPLADGATTGLLAGSFVGVVIAGGILRMRR